jgi:hypothetical protein
VKLDRLEESAGYHVQLPLITFHPSVSQDQTRLRQVTFGPPLRSILAPEALLRVLGRAHIPRPGAIPALDYRLSWTDCVIHPINPHHHLRLRVRDTPHTLVGALVRTTSRRRGPIPQHRSPRRRPQCPYQFQRLLRRQQIHSRSDPRLSAGRRAKTQEKCCSTIVPWPVLRPRNHTCLKVINPAHISPTPRPETTASKYGRIG